MNEKLYWLGLNITCGSHKMSKLLQVFKSAQEAWLATPRCLQSKVGWRPEAIEEFTALRNSLVLEREWEKLGKKGVYVVCLDELKYPENLAHIPGAPPLLYVRGDLKQLNPMAIAVVGARKASPYGLGAARNLGGQLAEAGVWVISGLARGIDSAAHEGALLIGKTVAVLGCGVDIVYPKENKNLMDRIVECGAVISEFPLGMGPRNWMFPARNRIISGLAKGVVVVEAEQRSGSLITVDFALEQGRDVFAVPGPVTSSTSIGPHNLIQQGAKLVKDVDDILEEIGWSREETQRVTSSSSSVAPLSHREEQVWSILKEYPLKIDELQKRLQIPVQELLTALMYLEIKGLVKQIPGQTYLAQ